MTESLCGVVIGALITGVINYFINNQRFAQQKWQYLEKREEEARIRSYEKFSEIALTCVSLKLALDEKQRSIQSISSEEQGVLLQVFHQMNSTLPVVLLYASDDVYKKINTLNERFFNYELKEFSSEGTENQKDFKTELQSMCMLVDEIHGLMRKEIRSMRQRELVKDSKYKKLWEKVLSKIRFKKSLK